ncbi:MAG: 16S rRNA (adenine(1518)-N(6)/adenine(1519)-N(6))-dimethyltransferase RsmA [Pseudomonadota bacterium]
MHRPKKRLGQHFLVDTQIIQQIIAAIRPQPDQHLVEIGPGQGVLTQPLLQIAGALDAIELDTDLIPHLEARYADQGQLRIHHADALHFAYHKLTPHPIRLVGNLPYNISTPLIFHLLSQRDTVQDMHFMLQQEVVTRMAAQPGNKTYGRLSVMVQDACQVEVLFDIEPDAFNPPPKVMSSFVRLTPIPEKHSAAHQQAFSQIVAQAFNQRRKTLRNSLKTWLTTQHIQQAEIAPPARAENLDVADYHRLAEIYLATCSD